MPPMHRVRPPYFAGGEARFVAARRAPERGAARATAPVSRRGAQAPARCPCSNSRAAAGVALALPRMRHMACALQ
jgi:hypothetical protein